MILTGSQLSWQSNSHQECMIITILIYNDRYYYIKNIIHNDRCYCNENSNYPRCKNCNNSIRHNSQIHLETYKQQTTETMVLMGDISLPLSYLSLFLFISLCSNQLINIFICLWISICLSIWTQNVSPSVCLFVYLSVCFPIHI